MQINHSDLKSFNIGELLSNNDKYIIPIYQRNYEWKKEQIEQLLLDVKDYFLEENDKKYYIGTLIVDKLRNKDNIFETIDGQQRLTTINILCCAMKHLSINVSTYFNEPIITFESRKNADETIAHVFSNGCKEEPKFLKYNVGIYDGMVISVDLITKLKKELLDKFEDFVKYFFEKVYILRAQVPEDTDMNHYFEIMNSRGEQLEKHEILKARLMRELNSLDDSINLRKRFNYIWEACADMSTNVQLHFQKDFRIKLFGDSWFNLKIKDAKELFDTVIYHNKGENDKVSNFVNFKEIIETNDINTLLKTLNDGQSINESEAEQFQPIINFENFLLHVLKIQEQSKEVSLDDKRLLSFFGDVLKQKDNKAQFVKDFAYQLLRTRFLLDQYVIRRKYTGVNDSWSLQSIKFYSKNDVREKDTYSYVNSFSDSNNKQLVQLLSMFHVSTPTQIYKYWLFAALNYLNENLNFDYVDDNDKSNQINENNYMKFLEKTSKNFMIYRHLAEKVEDYNNIILAQDFLPKVNFFDFELKLNYGNIESNLVFNYLDYLLWKNYKTRFIDFEFSFRSSVEHYYPQNPITGEYLNQELIKEENMKIFNTRTAPLDLLNCFGNLCLISHSNNSRLSNHMPKAKKDYFVQAKTKDSIKQMIMMSEEDYPNWEADQIFEHHLEMIQLLKETLFDND